MNTEIKCRLWWKADNHVSHHHYGTLQGRHNGHPGVSNHRWLVCLFSRLFRLISRKTSMLALQALCEGNPPVTGGFPQKGPVTWKLFPFDDVYDDGDDDDRTVVMTIMGLLAAHRINDQPSPNYKQCVTVAKQCVTVAIWQTSLQLRAEGSILLKKRWAKPIPKLGYGYMITSI